MDEKQQQAPTREELAALLDERIERILEGVRNELRELERRVEKRLQMAIADGAGSVVSAVLPKLFETRLGVEDCLLRVVAAENRIKLIENEVVYLNTVRGTREKSIGPAT